MAAAFRFFKTSQRKYYKHWGDDENSAVPFGELCKCQHDSEDDGFFLFCKTFGLKKVIQTNETHCRTGKIQEEPFSKIDKIRGGQTQQHGCNSPCRTSQSVS